jgi:hypothetical protein
MGSRLYGESPTDIVEKRAGLIGCLTTKISSVIRSQGEQLPIDRGRQHNLELRSTISRREEHCTVSHFESPKSPEIFLCQHHTTPALYFLSMIPRVGRDGWKEGSSGHSLTEWDIYFSYFTL